MLLGPSGAEFWVRVGAKNVFELYSSRLTTFVLVAYLMLFRVMGDGGWVLDVVGGWI